MVQNRGAGRVVIELHDNSILATSDPAVALWLFAHGYDRPMTLAMVRKAMQRALQSGKAEPLHSLIGIPRDGGRWRLHCRNVFLRKAAMLSPAHCTTERAIAGHMLKTAPKFIAESAPVWMQYGIPSSARDFDRLLCLAWQTEVPPPNGLRQWQSIVGEVCNERANRCTENRPFVTSQG